jgi:hypothetical protein
MSETARLANIFVSFYCIGEELPHDVIQLIFGLLLEIDTVMGFEVVCSDDQPPSVYWTGKYTNGSVLRAGTKIFFYGTFESTVLTFHTILPALILSIELNSMHATPNISHTRVIYKDVSNYVENHVDDKDMVIIGNAVVLDSDKIGPILRELRLVWEMIKNRDLTYHNDVLCIVSKPIVDTITNEKLLMFKKTKLYPGYEIEWCGMHTHGIIDNRRMEIKFYQSSSNGGYVEIIGILPSLILSLQYASINMNCLQFHNSLARLDDKQIDSVEYLCSVLGDFVMDSTKALPIIRELTLVWEKCRKKGLTYKNNRLCIKG